MKAFTILFCIALATVLFISTGLFCYLLLAPTTTVIMVLTVVCLFGIMIPMVSLTLA